MRKENINRKLFTKRMWDNCYLFWMLLGGVFPVSITHGPKGVLGFVLVFPDKHVDALDKGEHARRFDFLDERFRKRSLFYGKLNDKERKCVKVFKKEIKKSNFFFFIRQTKWNYKTCSFLYIKHTLIFPDFPI